MVKQPGAGVARTVLSMKKEQSQELATILSQVNALSELMQQVLQDQSQLSYVPAGLLTPDEAYKWLPYPDAESLRRAIRAGRFRSGREVQKVGRRWGVNVRAIASRLEKEQSRRRVV